MAWQRLLKGHAGLAQQPLITEDVVLGGGRECQGRVSEPTETTLSRTTNR